MTRYGRSMTAHGLGRALVYDPIATPMFPFKAGDVITDKADATAPVMPTVPYLWQ